MNPLRRIVSYLLPVNDGPPVCDHREANKQQAVLLLNSERDYWEAYYEKAWVEKRFADCEYARDQLDELERLECAA